MNINSDKDFGFPAQFFNFSEQGSPYLSPLQGLREISSDFPS